MTETHDLGPGGKVKPVTHAEFGMWVGLASFAMLFGTLFLSYGLARLRIPVWPPIGVEPLPKVLPTVSTFLLLASSVFVQQALGAFYRADRAAFFRNWSLTALLGAAFVVSQWILWGQVSAVGTHVDSDLFGGIFYAMTGLHALHIVGGLIALGVVGMKARRRGFFSAEINEQLQFPKASGAPRSQAPKLLTMYWHFMGFIWVAMYVLLIWI